MAASSKQFQVVPGSPPAKDIYQSGPSDSDQFIRKFSLTLLGANGQSWTLSDSEASGAQSGGSAGPIRDPLRIEFTVRCPRVAVSRQSMTCKIFNLSLQHPAAGLAALYNSVVLRAGYRRGQFGTIFKGQIINFRQGREPSLTETYLEIVAQGDFWASLGTTAQTFNAGTKVNAVVTSVVGAMKTLGVVLGSVVGLSDTPFIRGRAYYGMAVDVLQKHGIVYQQNGVVSVIGPTQTAAIAGGAIKVNANSGLIGMAEITGPNGVEFDVNLNPAMQIGSVVTINNRDINILAGGNLGPGKTEGPGIGQLGFFVDPSADGAYLVVLIEHHGDSRGNDWRTHVTAWPHGAIATPQTDTTVLANIGVGPTPMQAETASTPPNLPPDDSNY